MSKKKQVQAAIAAAASLSAALGATGVAGAAPTDGNWVPDQNVTYHKEGLTSAEDGGTNWGINNVNKSVMHGTSSTSTGQIEVFESPQSPGVLGVYQCTSYYPDGTNGPYCSHSDVLYDHDHVAGLSTTNWKWLGCHEIGHSAGMGERYDSASSASCQENEGNINSETALQADDLAEINKDFPAHTS
ncbi:MAG: hypothetical protein H0X25_06720 [Acidobacteriales bacterium]|nr:hypothetical protein [Terriglobales bacterium]